MPLEWHRQGEWVNRPNFFLEVWLQYLLGYPSILHGYPSNIHTFMPSIGSWCVIIHVSIIQVYINRSHEKSRFRSLQSILLPQFSTYRHKTGFIVKRKQVRITNYLRNTYKYIYIYIYIYIFFFYKFLTLFILPKNTHFSKNSIKFIIHFFFRKRYLGIRIYVLNVMITSNFRYL